MATPPPPNFPPIALPEHPNDPYVPLPAAPVHPAGVNDVLEAVRYRQAVDASAWRRGVHPPRTQCTLNDRYNSILYEHNIVAQAAAAAADPQAVPPPPWFQVAIEQLRNMYIDLQNDMRAIQNEVRGGILPALQCHINKSRGDGIVIPLEVVPFVDGDDPTQPPNNLPHPYSFEAFENLTEQELIAYLIGYGIDPLPTTNDLQKQTLRRAVGCTYSGW